MVYIVDDGNDDVGRYYPVPVDMVRVRYSERFVGYGVQDGCKVTVLPGGVYSAVAVYGGVEFGVYNAVVWCELYGAPENSIRGSVRWGEPICNDPAIVVFCMNWWRFSITRACCLEIAVRLGIEAWGV